MKNSLHWIIIYILQKQEMLEGGAVRTVYIEWGAEYVGGGVDGTVYVGGGSFRNSICRREEL